MAAKARSLSNVLLALLLVSVMWVGYTASQATATHDPANKAAAAGSDIDEILDDEPILTELFKVSSPEDAIVLVTAECSILTRLNTNNNFQSSTAYGSVRLFVTLDGKRVPVSTDDTAVDPEENPQTVPNVGLPISDPDASDTSDIGEITFCNRAYSRTVQDNENPPDGVDVERDYIRTRTANGFNWLALDMGVLYDDACVGFDPADPDADPTCVEAVSNGNNIIEAKLWADYDEATAGHPSNQAEAFVGSRTMILEPTKVSIHEQVERDDPDGGS